MPYCAHCGYKMEADDEECPSCGALVQVGRVRSTLVEPKGNLTSAVSTPSPVSSGFKRKDTYVAPEAYVPQSSGSYPAGGAGSSSAATSTSAAAAAVTAAGGYGTAQFPGMGAASAAATGAASGGKVYDPLTGCYVSAAGAATGAVGAGAAATSFGAGSGSFSPASTAAPIQEKGSVGWLILGLFFPFIGLILFLVWFNNRKADSRKALTGSIIGIALSIILSVGAVILGLIFFDNDGYDHGYSYPSGPSYGYGSGGYGPGDYGPAPDAIEELDIKVVSGPGVLVSNEVMTVKFVELNEDGRGLWFEVTNNCQLPLWVHLPYSAFNGWTAETVNSVTVEPGETARVEFRADAELDALGIKDIQKADFVLTAVDDIEYDTLYYGVFTLYPTGTDPADVVIPARRTGITEYVVMDKPMIQVLFYGAESDGKGGVNLTWYFENRTAHPESAFLEDIAVNGNVVDGIEGIYMPPQTQGYITVHISSSDMRKIGTPKTIQFGVSAYDEVVWDAEYLDYTLKL